MNNHKRWTVFAVDNHTDQCSIVWDDLTKKQCLKRLAQWNEKESGASLLMVPKVHAPRYAIRLDVSDADFKLLNRVSA